MGLGLGLGLAGGLRRRMTTLLRGPRLHRCGAAIRIGTTSLPSVAPGRPITTRPPVERSQIHARAFTSNNSGYGQRIGRVAATSTTTTATATSSQTRSLDKFETALVIVIVQNNEK